MAKKMAEGGDSAQKAFMATVAAISSMEDPLEQQQAGVALFGTQWEDVQKSVIGAMDPTKDVLGEVAGATDKAGKALKNNLGDRAAKDLRELGATLIPLGNILLDTIEPAFESASEHIKEFTEWMEGLSPTGKKTVVAIAAITAALGPVAIGLGFVVRGVGSVTGALSTGIGVFGKYRTSAMLTTATVNNLGNSATITGGKLKGADTAIGKISGKLAGMGGTVLSTTKNIGNLSKIMGVARLGVGALGGPVGLLATVGLPLLIQGGVKLYKHLKEDSIPTIENFGNKVSDSTSKAVLGYKKLNDDATTQLNELMWSGEKISAETSEKLTTTFGKMGDQISESLKSDFDESYKNLSTFLSNSKTLSETEQQEILNNMKLKQEEQQKSVQESENRIKQIMDKASQEKRTLTQAEKDEINMIQNQMMTTAVQTMSQSEVEQKAIMEKLKNESANITAQQAATTVQNSLKAKDGAVKEANDKYNKTVAAIIRERDETGSISAQQAEKMIKEAQRQRDKSVSAATEMHEKVVKQAELQAAGQADQVDWTTGQVLSNWDLMLRGSAKTINAMSSGINWVLDKIGVKSKIPMWEPKGYNSKKNSGASSPRRATGNMEQYAKGTPSSGHPGGPAIVGERGRELAHIPGQGVTLLGTSGAEYHSNLPKGTSVLPNKPTERLLKSYGFPGYEDGVGNFFDWALKGPQTLMDNVWKKFGVSMETPGGAFKSLGDGIMSFLNDKTLSFFKSKIEGLFNFGGSAASGSVKSWIAQAMAITGVPSSWASALTTIAMKESGGNPRAFNNWDINAKRGIASRGLMQTIPPTFEAYKMAGLNDIFNPVHNAVAAIRYIQARYGNVFNVPGIKSMESGGAYKGYATGGEINHPQLAMLGENRWKEWVITSEPRYRKNNLSLWAAAGQSLGVLPEMNSIPKSERKSERNINNSSSRGDTNINIYPQQVSMNETDLMRTLQRMEALYG
ncbi:transglycosylase SLT domain-containing protein [Metabacillus halosaccharovorans]|uniref:transglycosylase SLT domain-containing protein n=1 Tax=Metabacillus halosaccharovorans TaxID=930124 RepID=UPI0034CEC3A1